MVDVSQFKQLQKQSAKSFNDQKALIKKVMAGREMNCSTCSGLLQLVLPEHSEQPGIKCQKGCTDIQLDFTG